MIRYCAVLVGVVCLLLSIPAANASAVTSMLLDAGGGVTATIDVATGNIVTCAGTCGGLVITSTGEHSVLTVNGTIGQFSVNATGRGGLATIDPTLQNLDQTSVASAGPGTLRITYSDTGYLFGPDFTLSMSTVSDVQIAASTTDFLGYADGANTIPADSLIGAVTGLLGPSDSAWLSAVNPVGASGSLSSWTKIDFSGAGTVQTNFTISSSPPPPVPEPSSFMLLGSGMAGMIGVIRRKCRH